jgi:PAS domain S-box-containing protein
MDIIIILAISVLFQFTAAILALRLIRVTGSRIAWILIATAVALMALRRVGPLFQLLSGDFSHPPDLAHELVGLAISLLMLIGIALIAPLFLFIKRSEEAVRKTNRALKVLIMSNRAVIRSTEELTLIKDVCRSIVEVGGYRMAWVGFAVQDEEKTVRPVAHAGHDDGYIESANITWANTERGRYPTGKAIRTGRSCIANNILTDSDYAPWRDEATKRGYASSIALPLISNSQTIGALNIYAVEPDAFDAEEVNLLMQLAGDLSYGIAAIRTRAEHKRAEEAIKESEHRFKAIFDNAADGILVADKENKKFFSGNRMICQMLGYTEEEIKTLGVMDIHPEEDLPYVIDQFERQAKGEFTLASNIPVKRKDGSIFYADVNSFSIKLAGKTYLLGDFRDITERKKAEELLRKSEEELKKRVKELEEFYQMAVGRELRMIELKNGIERLENELKRYKNS